MGHKPVFADNGLEALTLVKTAERHFDLVLMDYEMPEMNGLESTKQIRRHEAENALQALSIFALTAHAFEEHRQQCIDAGMNGVLTKPLERQELQKVSDDRPS